MQCRHAGQNLHIVGRRNGVDHAHRAKEVFRQKRLERHAKATAIAQRVTVRNAHDQPRSVTTLIRCKEGVESRGE